MRAIPTLLLKIDAGLVVFLCAIAVLIGVLLALMVAADRRRRRALFDALRLRGFTVTEKPDRDQREALFLNFLAVPDLRNGGSGLRWTASGRVGGRPVQIMEHSYTVHHGKNTQTIVNTCIAAVGGVSWPLLTLAGENLFDRIGEKLGMRADLKLEDDHFNKRWRIRCDDEGFALAMLTPEVQSVIGEGESREWWVFGGPSGLACLGRRQSLDAPKLEAALVRLETVLAALPPEARAGLGL
jgi:hypothetical protein